MTMKIQPVPEYGSGCFFVSDDDLADSPMSSFTSKADAELFVSVKEMLANIKAKSRQMGMSNSIIGAAMAEAVGDAQHVAGHFSDRPEVVYGIDWGKAMHVAPAGTFTKDGEIAVRKIPIDRVESLGVETTNPVYSDDLCPHCGGAVQPRKTRAMNTRCMVCFEEIFGDDVQPDVVIDR